MNIIKHCAIQAILWGSIFSMPMGSAYSYPEAPTILENTEEEPPETSENISEEPEQSTKEDILPQEPGSVTVPIDASIINPPETSKEENGPATSPAPPPIKEQTEADDIEKTEASPPADQVNETESVKPETPSNNASIAEKRPYITKIELMAYDNPPEIEEGAPADFHLSTDYPAETDLPPSEVFYLPAENMTQVRLNSLLRLTVSVEGELVHEGGNTLISLIKADGSTAETEFILEKTEIDSEAQEYTFVLAPSKPLEANTTYYIQVNPNIKNAAGAAIISKKVKFTTRPAKHSFEIHGHYRNNTNSCASCHSVHTGGNAKLITKRNGSDPSGQIDATYYVCMSCHDGTVAPKPVNDQESNAHHASDPASSELGVSCASCHTPHKNWTEENPNKLKGSYVQTDTNLGSEGFDLCLRCHNGEEASDIQRYYGETAASEDSGHQFSTESEDPFSGQLACTECHETHGSKNIKQLKETLGHENPTGFIAASGDWDTKKERVFCLSCHNGKTAVNGLPGSIPDPETSEGHEDASKSCSSCHGGESKSFIEAAHSPKKLKTLDTDGNTSSPQ